MGLDISHDCWNGPYSSFNRFRKSLAQQIGIDLNEYIGYGNEGIKDLTSINHDLMPLFNHSDCDGRLSINESKQIAKGLDSILLNLNNEIVDCDFKESIIKFRNGCLDAISKNETIIFC